MSGTRKRKPQEFIDQIHLLLNSLEILIAADKNGEPGAWLPVPGVLWVLLCDTDGGRRPTLIDTVIPDFSLHPLLHDASKEPGEYLLYVSGMEWDQHRFDFTPFDPSQPRIPLAQWLEQTVAVLGGTPITLGKLISETRHQEGAGHFDPEVRETVQATTGLRFREMGDEKPFHAKLLVSIAEYIVSETKKQLPSP